MSLSSAANNIPLTCIVCIRDNDFSDVSHLLTHINSKGHLSNVHKTSMKASQDAEAQQTIDDYNEWLEEYDILAMVQERLAQKESKKLKAGGAPTRRSSTPGLAMASSRITPAPAVSTRQQSRLRNSTVPRVDPALNAASRLSQRPQSRPDTPLNGFSPDVDYIGRSGLPPMHTWTFSRPESPIKQESVSSEYSDGSYEVAPRPVTRRRRAQPHHMSGSNASVYDDNLVEELVNDSTKLKGIIWPGMDLFDSATCDMRRKRNQKKHESVLQQLQATSEDTHPTEQVYKAGYLAKERVITGNIDSDDSLISGESEPEADVAEKKRARRQRPRARAPLADKNTNNGRVLRTRGKGAAPRPTFGRIKKNPYLEDEEEEERLTFGRKKSRGGLSIHRDNSGPDITFGQQSIGMSHLNSAFDSRSRSNPLRRSTPAPADFGQSSSVNAEAFTPRTHFRQPSNSWGQLNASFRPVGFSGHVSHVSGHNMPSSNATHFGQYSTHAAAAPQTRPSVPQQYFTPTHYENPLFQPHHSAGDSNAWDHSMFSLTTADLGMQDMTFPGEMTNPLFFASKSDDEETISAANSEH